VHEIWLSADYPRKVRTFRKLYVERHAFPRYNLRKGMSFREAFCVMTGFPTIKSVESFDFLRIILRKGQAFPQDNSRKVKTFRRLYCGKAKCLHISVNLKPF
jgi:hypothetical protein